MANELKWDVIRQLKDRMRQAEKTGGTIGNERARVLQEASEIAARLRGAPQEVVEEFARSVVQARVDAILGTPVGYDVVEVGPGPGAPDGEQLTVEVYAPEREKLASQFIDMALHGKRPIANADAAYKDKRLRVSAHRRFPSDPFPIHAWRRKGREPIPAARSPIPVRLARRGRRAAVCPSLTREEPPGLRRRTAGV